MTKKDPALAIAEMRDIIDRAVEQARQEGVPHYRISQLLDDASRNVRIRHSATAPI